jgi:hypothetical protein
LKENLMTPIMTLAPSASHYLLTRWRQAWHAATQKPQAKPRSVADDAAAVRALADSYRQSDPGFASDLYAAAERHERDADLAPR